VTFRYPFWFSQQLLNGFTIRFNDIPDRPYYVAHRNLVKLTYLVIYKINLRCFDGEDILTLSDTVFSKTKLASFERDTIRKLASNVKSSRRAHDGNDVMPSVERFPRHHDDWVWSNVGEIYDVDISRPDHGSSRSLPAAFRRPTA
jgi:hypothetical protein